MQGLEQERSVSRVGEEYGLGKVQGLGLIQELVFELPSGSGGQHSETARTYCGLGLLTAHIKQPAGHKTWTMGRSQDTRQDTRHGQRQEQVKDLIIARWTMGNIVNDHNFSYVPTAGVCNPSMPTLISWSKCAQLFPLFSVRTKSNTKAERCGKGHSD